MFDSDNLLSCNSFILHVCEYRQHNFQCVIHLALIFPDHLPSWDPVRSEQISRPVSSWPYQPGWQVSEQSLLGVHGYSNSTICTRWIRPLQDIGNPVNLSDLMGGFARMSFLNALHHWTAITRNARHVSTHFTTYAVSMHEVWPFQLTNRHWWSETQKYCFLCKYWQEY